MSKEEGNKSLLQKAKSYKAKRRSLFIPTKEFEDVALAWCNDEVTHTQICKALGLDNTGFRVYSMLALTLKNYIRRKNLNPNQS